jgi:hypothetical protein
MNSGIRLQKCFLGDIVRQFGIGCEFEEEAMNSRPIAQVQFFECRPVANRLQQQDDLFI